MTLALSLLAAAAYGLGDFCGGLTSRRVSAWTVAFVVQAVGTLATGAVALVIGGSMDGSDLAWAAVAGLANGVGTTALYRGLAAGRMGVVAPVSGVGAAVVPVAVGVALGEHLGGLAWAGVLLALPAIWLVSRPAVTATVVGASGLLDGLVAGAGFGTLFVALSRVGSQAGLYPLAVNQAVACLTVAVVATALGEPWLPRRRRAALGAVSGILGAVATGLFLVTSRGGHLAVAAVIVALYPAFTVALAASVLRERMRGTQVIGLGLCAVAVAMVATG